MYRERFSDVLPNLEMCCETLTADVHMCVSEGEKAAVERERGRKGEGGREREKRERERVSESNVGGE